MLYMKGLKLVFIAVLVAVMMWSYGFNEDVELIQYKESIRDIWYQ